jgi:hypothetical protein
MGNAHLLRKSGAENSKCIVARGRSGEHLGAGTIAAGRDAVGRAGDTRRVAARGRHRLSAAIDPRQQQQN